jgi:hypothetical protein
MNAKGFWTRTGPPRRKRTSRTERYTKTVVVIFENEVLEVTKEKNSLFSVHDNIARTVEEFKPIEFWL